jgi:hypothetical protein
MKPESRAHVPVEPTDQQMLDSCMTRSGTPTAKNELFVRLQYLSDLLADAGTLSSKLMLLWREKDRSVKHFELEGEVLIGREPGNSGLTFAADKLLSRSHFTIHNDGKAYFMEDLKSHNGTAVNDPGKRLEKRELCDGDIIFAGNQIFAFLDQRKTG